MVIAASPWARGTTLFRRDDADADVDADVDDGEIAWDVPSSVAQGRMRCWASGSLQFDEDVCVDVRPAGHSATAWNSGWRRIRVVAVAEGEAGWVVMYLNWNVTSRNDSYCNTTPVADWSCLNEDTDNARCGWRNSEKNAAAGYAVCSDTWDPTCHCMAQSTWCDSTWY